jgi:hypothetical protein
MLETEVGCRFSTECPNLEEMMAWRCGREGCVVAQDVGMRFESGGGL